MNPTVPLWASHLPPASEAFRSGYHDKPRSEILPLIDWQPRCVLDIGCGGGATGQLLASRFAGCRLLGVERDVQAAGRAARHYHQVVQADLDQQALVSLGLPLASVDTVLLLDVLEHLVNPWRLLASLAQALPPGARLLASLPNIANIEALHALASGHWPYAEDGLFDITHLRFFTPQGMDSLLREAGLVLLRQAQVAHPPSRLPPHIRLGADHVETDRLVLKGLDAAQAGTLFAIQRLMVAQVPPSPPVPDSDEAPAPPPAAEPLALPAVACQASGLQGLRERYLDMVRRSLLGLIHDDPALVPNSQTQTRPFDPQARDQGLDWPAHAESMIGQQRMFNLQCLAEQVLVDRIPGDLIETGVWRGGACIMMRAVLQAYEVADRRVWVADSFAGLPPPSPALYPLDAGDSHHQMAQLAVPLDQVQRNFARYGLLDDQVRFLPGWFKDTLPAADTGPLALMRLDGDMYESTLQALEALFPRMSPGGFVIIDDYGYIASCQAAVDDYRARLGIQDPLVRIDQFGVYWRNVLPHALRAQPWQATAGDVMAAAGLAQRWQRSPGGPALQALPPLQVVDLQPLAVLPEGLLQAWHVGLPRAGAGFDAGMLRVAGWVIGGQAAARSVALWQAGRQLQQAAVALPRPDVAALHAGAGHCGFDLLLRRDCAEAGPPCELQLTLADGQSVPLLRFRLAPVAGAAG